MEATISKKTASDLAAEAIESFRQMHAISKMEKKSPAKKAPTLEARHFGMAAGCMAFLCLAYLCFGILMGSLSPSHVVCGAVKTKKGVLTNVSVIFHCPKSKKTYGQKTDAEGKYKIEVPHGTFKVAVMGDEIPSRYMSPSKSPLKADVFHNTNLDFSIADK